ncbi:unnamed protein product [Parascedosporium putredinis]|uniref:GTP-binding protein Obg/CgtA n=1 Tax=Parascedosporium putredinis TaxID=1442378 RepID=A0A9P1GUI6_9PEZI|nr:unnamed protein product [Parascedosporium putredinis]CAI7987630.1 unnamed protein product [Parascedosporium putredinis]
MPPRPTGIPAVLKPRRPPRSRLNPAPDDYAAPNFADKAKLDIYAGPGGAGCIAFLREAYFPNGPANGGDGGHGGNVYIQAVSGETSLHKISRRRFGDDVVITVPVGTVVREVSREDPVAEEAMLSKIRRELVDPDNPDKDKWVLYPGLSKSESRNIVFPACPAASASSPSPRPHTARPLPPHPAPRPPRRRRHRRLGQPHFVSREHPRPLFATKGEDAVSLSIELELKLLADVGLVGLPNAGKSTLLRSLSNSRTRVGNWAFTTLQPNIGTVVLDKNSGRPAVRSFVRYPAAPELGLPEEEIAGAHLDRGLGIAFLRHVERARVLAFVLDLSAGNAVAALKALWNEVGLYAQMREEEERSREIDARVDWRLTSDLSSDGSRPRACHHIASKPWFVVATKADLPETQNNFRELKAYIDDVGAGAQPHPTGLEGAWTKRCAAIPVSAIHGQGVESIVHWTVGLLDDNE